MSCFLYTNAYLGAGGQLMDTPSSFGTHFQIRKVKELVAQLCQTLCGPMDYNLKGSFVHGILQEEILEWVAIPFSRGSSPPRDRTRVSCTVGSFFTIGPPGRPKSEHIAI